MQSFTIPLWISDLQETCVELKEFLSETSNNSLYSREEYELIITACEQANLATV